MAPRIAYRPACDDRVVVPECSGPRTERVYLRDLASWLFVHPYRLRCYAEKRHLATGRGQYRWVTPYGAARLIAHFRALQGWSISEGGRDTIWRNLQRAERERRKKAAR